MTILSICRNEIIFNNLEILTSFLRFMPKKTDMILRCLDYYIDFLHSNKRNVKTEVFQRL